MNPEISVIVPVYNVEKYLANLIKSITVQSYSNFELILIDDCSTDKSLDIIKEFMKKDSRIKVLQHAYNRGTFKARETGYTNAKGNYITFCDGDDCLTKDALENLYNEIIKTKSDLVIANMATKEDNKLEISPIQNKIKEGLYTNQEICIFLLEGEMLHALHSKIFRADIFKTLREFPNLEHFCNYEDEFLYYNILQHTKKIIYLNKVTYIYNIHAGSASQKDISNNILENICSAINERYRIFHLNKQVWPIAKRSCSNDVFWLVYLMHCDKKKVLKCLNYKEANFYFKWYLYLPLKLRLRCRSIIASMKPQNN